MYESRTRQQPVDIFHVGRVSRVLVQNVGGLRVGRKDLLVNPAEKASQESIAVIFGPEEW
jgi:hypothetical protein